MTLEDWVATRPECVQKLAKEFPLGTAVRYEGRTLHLIGYTEGDELILSPVDPFIDYHEAVERRVLCCADHLR